VHDAVYDRLPLMHDDDDDIEDEDSQDTGFVDQENQESQDQISFSGNFVTALVAAFVFIGLPFLYWQHPADSSAFLHLGLDPCDYGNSSNLVQESKLFSRNHPILTMRGLNDDDDVTEYELFLIRRQDGDHDLPLGCSPPSSTSIFERGDSCRCQRVVYRTHKMGYELSEDLFRSTHKVKLNADQLLGDHHYVDHSQQDYAALANATDLALDTYYPTIEDRTDFRHILMMRDIYDSLVSGYLYHSCTTLPSCVCAPWFSPMLNFLNMRSQISFSWEGVLADRNWGSPEVPHKEQEHEVLRQLAPVGTLRSKLQRPGSK